MGRPAPCSSGAGVLAAPDFVHPLGDVIGGVDAVVEVGALHVAFTLGEDLQIALWTIDRLFVGAPLQRGVSEILCSGIT